jgi:hypothetical protein
VKNQRQEAVAVGRKNQGQERKQQVQEAAAEVMKKQKFFILNAHS